MDYFVFFLIGKTLKFRHLEMCAHIINLSSINIFVIHKHNMKQVNA